MVKREFLVFGLVLIFLILAGCVQQNTNPNLNNAAQTESCTASVASLTNVFSEKGVDVYAAETYAAGNIKKLSDSDLASIKGELSSLKSGCAANEKISAVADIYLQLADELKKRKELIVKSAELENAMKEDPCNALDFKESTLALYAELNSIVLLKENKLKKLSADYGTDAEIISLELDYLGNQKYFTEKNLADIISDFKALEEVCK